MTREIIGYITYRGMPRTEISNDDGIFGIASAGITYQREEPAVQTSNEAIALDRVRIATPEQRDQFIELCAEQDEWRRRFNKLESDIALNGTPMTWEWILEHGKPTLYHPVPFGCRTKLAKLRKGSKVVITSQSSAYWKIAGKVGKVVAKRTFYVIVNFDGRSYKIPYPDLDFAQGVSKTDRARIKQSCESGHKIMEGVNKVFGDVLR